MISATPESKRAFNTGSEHVVPKDYWDITEPLLSERGIEPLEYVASRVRRMDAEIEDLPAEVFTSDGPLDSPLLETHRLLRTVLSTREQGFSEEVAKLIFPHWQEQLKDVQDYLEGR